MSEGMNKTAAGMKEYPHALKQGTIVGGKYIIESVIGQGGFGITYLALDYQTKEKVAIKEYYPEMLAARTEDNTVSSFTSDREQNFSYGKECFLQEAKTLAEFIGNKNIVRIISYFEENNTAYFAMEYVQGVSLKSFLESRGGKLNWEETQSILFPVMDALGAVHAKGIIHRDISPDNIILTDSSEIKLIDFGAARYSLGDKSRSLDVVLKHGYAPKEQYTRHGKQGPFTDIYSLGATFYKTLTGRIPPDSIDRLEEDEIILPSTLGCNLPEQAETAIVKALAVQPADRFQSMAEFKAALQADVPSEGVKPVVVPAWEQPAVSPGESVTGTPAAPVETAEKQEKTRPENGGTALPQAETEKKTALGGKKKYLIAAAVITAIVIALASVTAIVQSNKRKVSTVSATKAEQLSDDDIPVKIGLVKDNTYENEYFHIAFTLPQQYRFKTKEEMFDGIYSGGQYIYQDRYAVECYGGYNDADVISTNGEGGGAMLTYVYEKNNKEAEFTDCESYLKGVDNEFLVYKTEAKSISDIYDVKIANCPFKAMKIECDWGDDYFFVTENNGKYFLIRVFVDNNDEKAMKVFLNMFYAL